MRNVLLILIISGFVFLTNAYDKLSLVERFTNASCGPCAQLNTAWYTATSQNYVNSGLISHIVYNVWWPGAGDPMYLLNQSDNTTRTNYYGCNYVPWIDVNGTQISETQGAFTSAVASGNSQFAPFNIVISQGVISNNLIEIGIKIIRDPTDVTTFSNVKLRVALTEKTVAFSSPPGGNGETVFYSICRKMMPNAVGSTFTIPAPGDSTMISLQYVPTAEFLQAVNMDSLRVVAFIQEDNTRLIYQSKMHDVNQNYMATITTPDEYYFGASSGTAVYTAYVKNIGLFPDTYNFNLEFDGPAGWLQTFTTINGTFNLGETDTVTLSPGDSTEIQVNVNANSINGYGKTIVHFISNQGSFGNAEFRYTTFGLDVLIVDDDGGKNYQEYFQNELINLSSEYGIITSGYIPANVDSLNTFDIIIWNTGITEPGISPIEIDVIKTFLDNGGNLYLNGVDIAYQLADPVSPYYTSETIDFFTNYLHSSYILRQHSALITQGISGDPITDGLGMTNLAGGTGANTINHLEGHYANQISAEGNNSANILSFWLKPDEHPGIRALHGTSSKVVFTAFGFETIALAERRALFAERILDWLDIPVSVGDNQSELLPASFELMQNYPNPFNPGTVIEYEIPNTTLVSIKVYDLIGREVAVLVNEVKQPGVYRVSFDGEYLASGVYFYKMIAGDFSVVKKMNLLK
ncbi:MAG: T9SS type A sorting domain-containing protein [Ignavibacteriaceae bacterium]|nr:T9SS type A sorting domain-containing protein [Ignavibacteriaceae bacterium]